MMMNLSAYGASDFDLFEQDIALAFDQEIISQAITELQPSLMQRILQRVGLPIAMKMLACNDYLGNTLLMCKNYACEKCKVVWLCILKK